MMLMLWNIQYYPYFFNLFGNNEDKTFAFCNHYDEEKGLLSEWNYCTRCSQKLDWSE